MNRIKKISRYEIIIADKYLCVPACLEIILRSHLYQLNQHEIAEYFSIHVFPDYNGTIKNILYTNDPKKLGVILERDSINSFFDKFNLPFSEEFVSIKLLQDWMFEDKIKECLALGSNLICGFSYGYLYKDKLKYEIGHVSIIESITEKNVILIDPGPLNAGSHKVEICDLYNAIRAKNDGLWVITKKCKNE